MKHLKLFEGIDSHDDLLTSIIYGQQRFYILIRNFNEDVNFTDDDNFMNKKMTPFMYAIYNDREEYAKELISFDADVDAQDEDGKTSLMLAAEMNNWNLIVFLIEDVNADMFIQDNDGEFFTDYLDEIYFGYIKEDYPLEYEEIKGRKEAGKYNL